MENALSNSEKSILPGLPGIHAEIISIIIAFVTVVYFYVYPKIDELKNQLDNYRREVEQITDIKIPIHKELSFDYSEYLNDGRPDLDKITRDINAILGISHDISQGQSEGERGEKLLDIIVMLSRVYPFSAKEEFNQRVTQERNHTPIVEIYNRQWKDDLK